MESYSGIGLTVNICKCTHRLAKSLCTMWHGILGHDEVVEQFRRTLAAGRLASTYLFVGPAGIGKKRFAMELARCLLCQRTADDALEACGECESCRLFAAGNHPDLEVVGLPPDKSELPIALFVGDDRASQPGGAMPSDFAQAVSRRTAGGDYR